VKLSLEKRQTPRLFLGQGLYVGKRWAQRGGRGGHTTPLARPGWPAWPGGVGPSWLVSISSSGSVSLLVKYEFCDIFWEFS
jgi:hypothetical protein